MEDLNRAPLHALTASELIERERAQKVAAGRPVGRVNDLKGVPPKRVYRAGKDHLIPAS